MVLYAGVDAAFPGPALPNGVTILAAYIGDDREAGAPDTPHVWTAAEWNSYINTYPGLHVLPIYTHNFLGDPIADANNACDAAETLGWSPRYTGDSQRIIALDLETLIAPTYVERMIAQIDKRGFAAMPYGSNGTVKANPMGIGYWVADLVMSPPKNLGVNVQGVQYKFGNDWDSDVFSQRVYDGCGVGLRHG